MTNCNRGCGQSGLNWKVINGKYKLFGKDDLLHICNDGDLASEDARSRATARILTELHIDSVSKIPDADTKKHELLEDLREDFTVAPNKMFTINTTSNGIAITGDDKHNPIYLPKVAVPELIKALVDFI